MIKWGELLDKGSDLALAKIDSSIDRERSETVVSRVKNPTPTVTAENTGAGGVPGTYKAGTVGQEMQIGGMPWHKALLFGSLALLGLGVAVKVVAR
jgi:hypothetical protein